MLFKPPTILLNVFNTAFDFPPNIELKLLLVVFPLPNAIEVFPVAILFVLFCIILLLPVEDVSPVKPTPPEFCENADNILFNGVLPL